MNDKITNSEMRVLRILWDLGPSKVRTLNDELNKKHDIGYTSTLKLMQTMNQKGMLTREKEGVSHVYSSAIDQNKTQKSILNKILEYDFAGSKMNLMMQLFGDEKTDKKDMDEIRSFIKKMDKANENESK